MVILFMCLNSHLLIIIYQLPSLLKSKLCAPNWSLVPGKWNKDGQINEWMSVLKTLNPWHRQNERSFKFGAFLYCFWRCLEKGTQVLRVCEFFCGAWKLSLLAFLLLNWVRPVFRLGWGWGGGISLPFSSWCAPDQSHCLDPSSWCFTG